MPVRVPSFLLVIVAILALLGGGYYFLKWKNSDERLIQRNFSRIVSLAEKTENENPIAALSRSRELLTYFSSNPEIELGYPVPPISDSQNLAELLTQLRMMTSRIDIDIKSKTLTFLQKRRSAIMNIKMDVQVDMSGERRGDARAFQMKWVKENGKWVIGKVEARENF